MQRLLLLFCLLTTACDVRHDPLTIDLDQEWLTVHSLLVTGQDQASVLVTLVWINDQIGFGVQTRPIVDAVVRLRADGVTHDLLADENAASACWATFPGAAPSNEPHGCYAARIPGGLRAGVTYELEIDAGEHGQVHGRATLPPAPQFVAPAPNARIPLNTYAPTAPATTVRWSGVQTGRWTELYATPLTRDCAAYLYEPGETGGRGWVETMELDSVRVRIGDSGCNVPTEGMPAEFRLIAYDSAYTRYAQNFDRSSIPHRDASIGITGAFGVFAGAAKATLPITLIRD